MFLFCKNNIELKKSTIKPSLVKKKTLDPGRPFSSRYVIQTAFVADLSMVSTVTALLIAERRISYK